MLYINVGFDWPLGFYIFLLQMDLFLLKFMISAMTLILIWQIFLFWMVTFLVVLLMVYTFRNLLGLLESAIMLQTSTLEINV